MWGGAALAACCPVRVILELLEDRARRLLRPFFTTHDEAPADDVLESFHKILHLIIFFEF
jgi:hypothetical protein